MAKPLSTAKPQQPDWPAFQWQTDVLSALLREVVQLQGKLLGQISAIGEEARAAELDAMLRNILQSSAIEGENLNEESVRSSLAKKLGLDQAGHTPGTAKTEGLVSVQLDAIRHYQPPLTLERLYDWHRQLFATGEGTHSSAPPRVTSESELKALLQWLAGSRNQPNLDPILRAAVAHLWFITIHPFDHGNGLLARAITDYALAQAEHQSARFCAMAASIMKKRDEYHRILKTTQNGGFDITPWCQWFLTTLRHALEHALARVDRVTQKARFWQIHGQQGLNVQQVKVLNRLLDAGPEGQEGGLTASKYKGMAKVSKATATRHLGELLKKGCIVKLEGGGRSTRYEIKRSIE